MFIRYIVMTYRARDSSRFVFLAGEEKQAIKKFQSRGFHGSSISVELDSWGVGLEINCHMQQAVENPTEEALEKAAETMMKNQEAPATLKEAVSQIKDKIENAKNDLHELSLDSKNVLTNEVPIALLRGEINGYNDCLTLLEQVDVAHNPTDEEKEDLFKEDEK